ncbi:MAG TPA: hypothetical protein VH141_30510 [Pseudonocardia sp.]|nr:hypothetical protein [Pseudonocardia sp.]
MVRSFGSVAAIAAAALALLIGFLAFSAHTNHDQNRPPVGAQTGVPGGGRLVGNQSAPGPTELTASQASANATPAAQQAQTSANFVTFGGGSGGQAAASSSRGSCTPGLLQSLVGLVGALLGGGGASC